MQLKWTQTTVTSFFFKFSKTRQVSKLANKYNENFEKENERTNRDDRDV